MARLTDQDRELILADYHTGHYTQRELAKKYGCSPRTINLLVKGTEPKHIEKVNAIVTAHTQMAEESTQEVNAVLLVVEEKTKHLKLINDNATLLAGKITTMAQQIDTPSDLNALVQANDKLAITLKVADRHAPKIDITQQTAVQNTTPTAVYYIEDVQARD